MHLIIFLIILAIIIIAVHRSSIASSSFPYKQTEVIFTPAEQQFYNALRQVVEDDAIILSKVNIVDILKVEKGLNKLEWQKYINQISEESFDFVLCRFSDRSVICVIELEDMCTNTKKQEFCDKVLQVTCDTVGLKLHRFKVKNQYNANEIRALIFPTSTIKNDLKLNKC